MSYSQSSEPIRLERDCAAVMVPSGDLVNLPAGQVGYITQALGGSFTVFVEGNLFRIRNQDADALGKDPMALPELPDNASAADVEQAVWMQLRTCFDPEIPINIVDLGLVYECTVERSESGAHTVNIKLTLTAPGCGMGDVIAEDVKEKLLVIPGVADAAVEVVLDPPWTADMMSEAARLQTGMM